MISARIYPYHLLSYRHGHHRRQVQSALCFVCMSSASCASAPRKNEYVLWFYSRAHPIPRSPTLRVFDSSDLSCSPAWKPPPR